jgi:transposase
VTEKELARGAARRLAIIRHAQEVTGNVSLTCRYYGISRQAYYKWLRRYEEQGIDGLRDRSRAPHHCPRATRTEVVGKIIYLRENYHFGPHKIVMYLKRYHDVTISKSGVWRILKRLDMNRLPASAIRRARIRLSANLPGPYCSRTCGGTEDRSSSSRILRDSIRSMARPRAAVCSA